MKGRCKRDEVHEVFALNCGIFSSTKAKLLAILKGLLVAWEGEHKKVEVCLWLGKEGTKRWRFFWTLKLLFK